MLGASSYSILIDIIRDYQQRQWWQYNFQEILIKIFCAKSIEWSVHEMQSVYWNFTQLPKQTEHVRKCMCAFDELKPEYKDRLIA